MPSPPTRESSTSDEGHLDSENNMWSGYLDIVDEYDKRLTERWKEDTKGVLVFTALFSSIVASFIIQSYPLLSPNTGSQTVFLLGQLSQQFAGIANGTHVQPESYPSSPPSTSIICVNILWLLSFLLSTASALFATMMQQWGRVYIGLPQSQIVPSDRARVRSILWFGTKKYHMDFAVEIAPTLLHFSVFLFYIGLVIFFFTIYKTVAMAILISVGLFGLVYFTATILPCLDHSCPYSTPMSSLWWYLWHTFLLFVTSCLHSLLKLFYSCLVPYNTNWGAASSFTQPTLSRSLDTVEKFTTKHGGHLKDGFRETVVKYALKARPDTDIKALMWVFDLPALAEKSKIQKFVAGLPGKRVVELFSQGNSSDRENITFCHHLSTLFRTSCVPDTIVGVTEEMRKGRLVCLNALHHIAKASISHSIVSPSSFSPLDDMRLHFANMDRMRPLWAESDPAIRVTARSICALLAKQLLRKPNLKVGELSWLHDVMDRPPNEVFQALRVNDFGKADNMNFDSFVNGVLSQQTGDLPNVQAILFTETLQALVNTNNQTSIHADNFKAWLTSLIQQMEEEGDQDRGDVVGKLRSVSSSTTGRRQSPQSQASGA